MTLAHPETVREVLAISFQGIGNTLLALPALDDVKRALPAARLTLVVGDARQARVFELAESVDCAVPLPRDAAGRLRAVRTLRRLRADLTLVTFPHGRASAWLSLLAGGRNRTGHVDNGLHRTGRRLFHHRVPVDRSLHDVEQNRRLVAALGIETGTDHRSRFAFPEAVTNRVRSLATAIPGAEGRPILAIHPSCAPAFPDKRWSLDRYGETAAILARGRGLLPVVLFGPGEEQMAREVVSASAGEARLGPELDLVETAAFLAQSRLVLSNDSGMMNLAVVLGMPTVGVFGPSENVRSRPLGEASAHVQADLDCCPCWSLSRSTPCPYETVRCMEAIRPGDVAAACERVLDAGNGGGS